MRFYHANPLLIYYVKILLSAIEWSNCTSSYIIVLCLASRQTITSDQCLISKKPNPVSVVVRVTIPNSVAVQALIILNRAITDAALVLGAVLPNTP